MQVATATTSAWVHSLDPFAIRFWGDFGIRWYGLAYLAGFLVGYGFIYWLSRRNKVLIHGEQIADFTAAVAIGTLVGGRLGYCLFYGPELFWTFESSFPYWGVLAVNKGGMASHGGILGIMVSCYWFARRHNIPLLHLFDLVCIGGTMGVFFGRIANFINGELIGRPCDPSLAWAVKFPQDMYGWIGSEISKLKQLGPAVQELGIQPSQWKQWVLESGSSASAHNQVLKTIDSLIQAIQSGQAEVTRLVAPVLTARHPSQIYQALMEGLLIALVLIWFWRKPRKPGLIGAVFFFLYGVMRVIGEQFRMPDAHLGFQAFGLTRGQWLSLSMPVIGIILYILWSRRDVKKLGGWAQKAQTPAGDAPEVKSAKSERPGKRRKKK